jgi:hypothetical protein
MPDVDIASMFVHIGAVPAYGIGPKKSHIYLFLPTISA